MANGISIRRKIVLGLAAVITTSGAAALTQPFPVPFYVGIFYVGPLAFLWFLLPALVVPLLVSRFPVVRQGMFRLSLVTLAAFGASVAYLMLTSSYTGNLGREFETVTLWLGAVLLLAIAGIGFLRESRAVTSVYHIVLATWFFAFGFPYLGEFL